MGLIAGMLGRSHIYTLRSGAACDIAHLPLATEGHGFTTHQERQSLNHDSLKTTRRYVEW
jgi:hypothetical protein